MATFPAIQTLLHRDKSDKEQFDSMHRENQTVLKFVLTLLSVHYSSLINANCA